MTQEAKIIGITKELLKRHNSMSEQAWEMCGLPHIHEHFYKIAKSLIIAVEALEKIEDKEYSSDEDDLNCVAHHCCCGAITYKGHMSDCEVMKALSKISSL